MPDTLRAKAPNIAHILFLSKVAVKKKYVLKALKNQIAKVSLNSRVAIYIEHHP